MCAQKIRSCAVYATGWVPRVSIGTIRWALSSSSSTGPTGGGSAHWQAGRLAQRSRAAKRSIRFMGEAKSETRIVRVEVYRWKVVLAGRLYLFQVAEYNRLCFDDGRPRTADRRKRRVRRSAVGRPLSFRITARRSQRELHKKCYGPRVYNVSVASELSSRMRAPISSRHFPNRSPVPA